MGHGLIAAEQSRDSLVDVYLYSSRRGPCIPREEAKPTEGSPLGCREAGEPLRGGDVQGVTSPSRNCFCLRLFLSTLLRMILEYHLSLSFRLCPKAET